jgi:hypothetical protein
MFKNAHLAVWPNKGMDDPCPLSMCNKYRYIIQVSKLHAPSVSHMCVAQLRYLTWGHIWKEVLQLPPKQWVVPKQVVLGKWDTMADAAADTIKQFDNRRKFLLHLST